MSDIRYVIAEVFPGEDGPTIEVISIEFTDIVEAEGARRAWLNMNMNRVNPQNVQVIQYAV